jgi:hypothetical protein
MKEDITPDLDCGIYQTEEPEDVKQLRSKLKAIETERKRDVASVMLKQLYESKKPFTHKELVDLMVEFEQTIKKTVI